jgi:hypothetical protein
MEGISSGHVLLRMMLMRSAKEDEEPWALQEQHRSVRRKPSRVTSPLSTATRVVGTRKVSGTGR